MKRCFMAILFQNSNQIFSLQTKNSTYQMKVDCHGVLLHMYYVRKTDDSDLEYLIVPADHGFSGQPGDVKDGRTYSMDYYPLEYPVHGNGDYRVTALKAGVKGQMPALDLRYVSHEITSGKYGLQGLPALFDEKGDQAETLVITLKDMYDEIYVKLLYGVYEELDIITRAAIVENRGEKETELKRVMSMSLDFLEGDLDLIHFYGKHTGERQFERVPVHHGITEISSNRGHSSHHHNPFVILCEKNASEDYGECYGFSLLYSGSFRMQIEKDQFDSVRMTGGLSDEEFLWELKAGESLAAPEMVLSFSDQGLSGLSDNVAKAFQAHLIRSPWKNRKRPILVNNWEATYFDFTGKKLLEIADEAVKLGLDMLVLDDGWFGDRKDDFRALGDWYVNEEKLGCTLRELGEEINRKGLKFGIWVEPEMISEDSDLYRRHPEWAMKLPGREPTRSRDQLCLDLSNKEVLDYLKGCLKNLLDSADIAYIKWDINRSIDNVYSSAYPKRSQGAVRHAYILALYELHEYLLAQKPDLLLEGCNGGGGRFDAGMLYYAPQIWCSDNSDAIERLRIHYGTSFGYPMSAVAAHVSVCPNHQNGRVVPFKTRGVCAMQGAFGYELDLSKMTEEEKAEAKEQIRFYGDHYELFQQGRYYRITSPFENRDFTAWSYVSKNQETACLGVVYTDLHANPKAYRVRLKGLKADAIYNIEGTRYTGAALMNGGLVLPNPQCNYDSCMILISEIK